MNRFNRRKFLKSLGVSAFAMSVGIPNDSLKANVEDGKDLAQNNVNKENSLLKSARQLNVKGFAYDYHTRKIIENARITITASQINVENNEPVLNINGYLMKEGLKVTAHLNKDGSYEIPLSKGFFQINVEGHGKNNHRYNLTKYLVVLNDHDTFLDIELARTDGVRRIENEFYNHKKNLIVSEIFL